MRQHLFTPRQRQRAHESDTMAGLAKRCHRDRRNRDCKRLTRTVDSLSRAVYGLSR